MLGRVSTASFRLTIGWISLAIIGTATVLFGVIAALAPLSADCAFQRALGMASIGMGVFGLLITAIPYRRRERWAWWALWYYPVFWSAHLLGGLPPGRDHIHQVLFIVLSLLGLVLPIREFFRAPDGGGTISAA